MMNAVNRVVIVILLLVAIVLCSTLLVFPVRSLDAVAQWLTTQADSLRQYDRLSFQWFVRVGLGVLFALTLDIIFGLLIYFEVRRTAPKAIRVRQASGGRVTLNTASIADRLKEEVNRLPHVISSQSKVSARRRGVVVELDAKIAAGVDVPGKADQIIETARQVVEEKMGLELARPPRVNLRAVPHTGAPGRPLVSPAESAVVEAPVEETTAE